MAEDFIIPIICGPTGSGKTAAALELAGQFKVEIISADSRQIIRHLNIGTAKPTPEELACARFHLIDLIEPGERYSAFRFIDDCEKAICEILDRDHIPLIVGGTGLYLKALTDGVVEIESDDLKIRARLENELEEQGAEALYARLESIDPLEAVRTHPHNKVRILRALEIFYLTGKTKSELATTGAYKKSERSFAYFCLAPERQNLYSGIESRVDQMMEQGLLEEVKDLLKQGAGERIRQAGVIGYAELLDHLAGQYGLSEAVLLIKQNSRRYAKRQMTWFRHQVEAAMLPDTESLVGAVGQHLVKVCPGAEIA